MLSEPAPALSSIRPGLGDGLGPSCSRACSPPTPGARPASARELLREVIRLVGRRRHAGGGRSRRSLSGGRSAGRDLRRPPRRARGAARGARSAGGRRGAGVGAGAGRPARIGAAGAVRRRRARARGRGRRRRRAADRDLARQRRRARAGLVASRRRRSPPRRCAARRRGAAGARSARRWKRAPARSRCASGWTRGRRRPRSRPGRRGRRRRAACCWCCRRARRPARPFADTVALAPLTRGGRGGAARRRGRRRRAGGRGSGAGGAVAQGNAAVAGVLARRLIADLRAGRGAGAPGPTPARISTGCSPMATARCRQTRRRWCSRWRSPTARVAPARFAQPANGDAAAARRARGGLAGATSDGAVRLPSGRTGGRRSRGADPAAAGTASRRGRSRISAADDPRRADALAAAGRRGEAAAVLRGRGGGGARRRRAGAARRCSTSARRRSRPTRSTSPSGSRSRPASGCSGRYDDAARALEAARAAAADGAPGPRCAERDAWLRARRGDTEGARVALERGLADAARRRRPPRSCARASAACWSRSGRFRDALAIRSHRCSSGGGAGGRRQRAARAVGRRDRRARLRVPRPAGARRATRSRAAGGPRSATGGARIWRRCSRSSPGREPRRCARYRTRLRARVARRRRAHGRERRANLAALLAEQGVYGEALAASERAVRELGRLGAAAELATALVNGANMLRAAGRSARRRGARSSARAGWRRSAS